MKLRASHQRCPFLIAIPPVLIRISECDGDFYVEYVRIFINI
jgi:hypothetical protein